MNNRTDDLVADNIIFHYLKPSDYRTFHIDGAVGGPTPRGGLFISFYLERSPIPQTTTHELTKQEGLGQEIARTGKDGVIREIECGVVMNLEAAKALSQWLEIQIQKLEQLTQPR